MCIFFSRIDDEMTLYTKHEYNWQQVPLIFVVVISPGENVITQSHRMI